MNRLFWGIGLAVGLLLTMGCALHAGKEQVARENAPFLSKSAASARSGRVSQVTYQLSLSLPEDNVPFTGTARIHFNLSNADQPLTVDFVDGEVLAVRVNGKEVSADYNGNFITLAPRDLAVGRQSLEIHYRHPYVRDGQGLHWFRDTEDGSSYLYTQFEVWSFNKVFPGFDQPDLKATFRLDVEAPASWTVVTAERETRIVDLGNDRRRWYFPDTQAISTYLFSLHAGPYQMWQEAESFRIPLRLFARKSYAQYVNAEDWFRITRQGLDYFENYFAYPYPFSKYDQLLVPEFNFGAMENVGAVTFAEFLQPRREQNYHDRRRMAVVVMHEMAHQWFGNLVTMRWWDDIWLNESFAEWMGSLATAKATEYADAMVDFSTDSKSCGYEEDQAATTHPIVQNIPNTDVVMSNMDGITYAKGAAVLMQLQYLLGGDTFERGIAEYFARHAWQNTSLHDFIGALSEVAQRNLNGWTQDWLMKEGVNALSVEYTCADERITQLDLFQAPANMSGAVREHSLDLLLLSKSGDRSLLNAHITSAKNTIANAEGLPCPTFVLPNVSDHTFTKVLLDKNSIAFVRDNHTLFTSAVERGMIWRSLWEAVQAGQLSPVDFVDLATTYLADENEVSLLRAQTYFLRRVYAYLENHDQLFPERDALAPVARRRLENYAYRNYLTTDGGIKQRWLEVWLTYLHSPEQRSNLKKMLRDNTLALDQQWWAVGILVRVEDEEAQSWIEQVKARDKSADAQASEWAALAQKPDLLVKQEWIKQARNPESSYSFVQMRKVLDVLFPVGQKNLHQQLREDIFAPFTDLPLPLNSQALELYASRLIPIMCDPAFAERLKAAAQDPQLPGGVVKVLKKKAQEEEICVQVMTTL